MTDQRDYAREAVELWEEYGLTTEYLEGMSYNHRVKLNAAARAWSEFPTDAQVEAAADAIRNDGWSCDMHEPGRRGDCAICDVMHAKTARAALEAARKEGE